MDCTNSDLMERIRIHFVKDFQLGDCTILSKTEEEEEEHDLESLKTAISVMSINNDGKCSTSRVNKILSDIRVIEEKNYITFSKKVE